MDGGSGDGSRVDERATTIVRDAAGDSLKKMPDDLDTLWSDLGNRKFCSGRKT